MSEKTIAQILFDELAAAGRLERGSDLYTRINAHFAGLDDQYYAAQKANSTPPALSPDDEKLQLAYMNAMHAGHIAETAKFMAGLKDAPPRPRSTENEVS
ncbi:MAG: hypothetical protein EB060_02720 [Proteobacteria bacterium]|nr:hypothetical protein [Pseudomonadota bacterium]